MCEVNCDRVEAQVINTIRRVVNGKAGVRKRDGEIVLIDVEETHKPEGVDSDGTK